ncbi:MAG: 16S rRNA (adenine(1518)-N(6)/adenine(1519)-N(6))-dimethyltransferase RsmA [Gammaproteobacteria bacterium]
MISRRRFGQHFLRDETILGELIARINPLPGEKMLEIGPGDGALTGRLLRAGATLSAVEIDRDLAEKLRAQFPDLHLIVGDALKEDLPHLLRNGMRVAGNLPYNISTPLLIRLAECRPREMWLMVQKEVAARVCAAPGGAEYGRLTVSVRLRYDAAAEMSAPPEAFAPPPKVDSAVIKLTRRDNPPRYAPSLPAIVAAAFQNRRKMLGNGLSEFAINWQGAEIDPSRRPQTLSPEEFARLSLYTEQSSAE